MIISGYKHETKKNIMYVSKTKMGKRELILEAVHSMWTAETILHFYLWTASEVLVVRERGMKATNLLKLYMYCNFSQHITETLTMLAPMLGLD